mgnify:CR=1 FL=1
MYKSLEEPVRRGKRAVLAASGLAWGALGATQTIFARGWDVAFVFLDWDNPYASERSQNGET